MKSVYISHPVAGNLAENVRDILKICKEIHTKEIIPVVPYLVALQYLEDSIKEDRDLGMRANYECLRRKFVDEVWLFGDRISSGMEAEIRLSLELGIPVIPKTKETEESFKKMIFS